MLEMRCQGTKVHLKIEYTERSSMLVVGNSRSGKTYFTSLLANMLITQGHSVQVIDLGQKWSREDKARSGIGAEITCSESHGEINLCFFSEQALLECSKYIVNALGFRSLQAEKVLNGVMKTLLRRHEEKFNFEDIISVLKENAIDEDWNFKLYSSLKGFMGAKTVWFYQKCRYKKTYLERNMIWNLDSFETTHARVMSQLILYWRFCLQRDHKSSRTALKDVFVFVDEFQNLDCTKESALGLCMTEGQKHHIYLVLATQFIKDRFSDAVVMQLKQVGFRFYFRLTENEAMELSRQIVYDSEDRQKVYESLIHLPRGKCLLLGPHSLGERREVSELPRLIEVSDC